MPGAADEPGRAILPIQTLRYSAGKTQLRRMEPVV
jgi:hypothetical protein